ncbi:MAG: hypothetical protein WAV47_25500, partial [Blastocatellia bacterium]
VRAFWSEAPDAWVDDFHHLSSGNPRVQQYALNYAGIEPQRALDYLRPSGKALDDVFLEQLKHALQKGGHEQAIKALCAGLVALPRPVPITDLSAVTDLSDASIRDLCSDLAPGVRLTNSTVTFADEDFEHFMRTEAEAELSLIRARIADHFMSRRTSDPYAAAHVGAALFDAGRGREIIDLVRAEPEPEAIRDPVLRRETQLQRLRIAMKVCREAGNSVDAILTLLVGAEALKTDAAIRRIFVESPDLAARFARDSSARFILRDPEQLEHHGPLLFHLMAADARAGDAISVREGYRQVEAWMQRRSQIFDEQERENPDLQLHGWSIGDYAIASEIEAVLRVAGPLQAVDYLLRWRPKSVALHVIFVLSFRLIAEGEDSLVERCLAEASISTPWDLFLLTPLALAGKDVDASRLEASLSSVLLRRLIKLDALLDNWSKNQVAPRFLEMILSACEVAIVRGCDRERIIPVLERFNDRESRRRDKISLSRASLIDLTLRAHVLLERMAGREPTVESYWIDPPQPQNQMSPKELERATKSDNEKKGEMKSFVGPLMELYDVRAQVLIGSIAPADVDGRLRKAIGAYHQSEYRFSRDYWASAMRKRAALSITRLMAIGEVDNEILFERASSMLGSQPAAFGESEMLVFSSLALDQSLHSLILRAVTSQAQAVRGMKISAEDKLSALTSMARLLVEISEIDAEAIFNEAVDVAGELDSEAIHEIALFAPLAERAVGSMTFEARRAVACDLATVVADAGVRLAGYDSFPWAKAARGITTLNLCLGLAATARWEDSGVVDRETFLPFVLDTALSRREISPTLAAAFLPVLDQFSSKLMTRVVQEARSQIGSINLT